MDIKQKTTADFMLISGDDMLTVPLFSVGAVALISVMANAYPAIFKKVLSSCHSGDFKNAAENALKTLKINALMYAEGNPVGVKQLLSHLGLCRPNVRLPLVKASLELSEEIKNQLL